MQSYSIGQHEGKLDLFVFEYFKLDIVMNNYYVDITVIF